jgi:hypothetical protein
MQKLEARQTQMLAMVEEIKQGKMARSNRREAYDLSGRSIIIINRRRLFNPAGGFIQPALLYHEN